MGSNKDIISDGAEQDMSLQLDIMRGISMCAVIIHHWLLFIPRVSSVQIVQAGVDGVETVAGTMVHLFFILSGYGLTLSYYKSEGSFSWLSWAEKRFVKIVFPYILIVTGMYFLVLLLHQLNHQLFSASYSLMTLLAYLIFLRNHYSPGSGFNPTLWFMPVIVGLYVLFPFLLMVLKRSGVAVLLAVSACLTYTSITLCVFVGYPVTHDTALPFFYIVEFSLGMVLACQIVRHPISASVLESRKAFGLGVLLYVVSWVMTRSLVLGDAYNDLLTAAGVLLITLYLCRILLRVSGERVMSALKVISKRSYLMYLLHGPLILFLAKPLLRGAGLLPLNSLVSLMLSIAYCGFIFILAHKLSIPVAVASRSLSKNLFRKDMILYPNV